MATPNSNHSKLGAFCIALSLFFFLGCKKNDVLLFKVAVQCEIPYDHTPIPGVKFKVVEYSSGGDQLFGPSEPTGFEMQGITGSNGRGQIAFTKRRKDTKNKYYQCFFDYSSVQSPYADYTLINTPQFIDVFANEPKDIYLRLLPKMNLGTRIQNVNCSGPSDSMRIIVRNISEFQYDINSEQWSPYNTGCYVNINGYFGNAGQMIYKIQVKRNGVLSEILDTVLRAPGVNDSLIIEY